MNQKTTQVLGIIIAAIGIFIFSLGGTAGIGGGVFLIQAACYVLGPVIAFMGVYLLIKDRRTSPNPDD